ncbi:MAG: hypothetical protein ABL974_17610 [Prosthecobacter sp.]
MSPRSLCNFALICLCLISVGCSSFRKAKSDTRSDIIEATGFWQPHLMYLLKSPYARLYVEVDAVKGSEPDAARLDKLREFLKAHCQKPGGIEIVRDDVIPIQEAQGLPHKILAQRFIDGPPKQAGSDQAAYLYVLCYDGALCDRAAKPKPKDQRERNANPHVDYLPYPAAMYLNTRYARLLDGYLGDDLALHEAGHLLGLSRRKMGASGHHCLDSRCLMKAQIAFRFGRLLTGRDPVTQHQLCQGCETELVESAKAAPSAKLRFVGPVLVRSETGYHVLSLPGHLKLVVGALTDRDCRNYAIVVREKSQMLEGEKYSMRYIGEVDKPPLPAKTKSALRRAKNDPYAVVREVATGLEKALIKE